MESPTVQEFYELAQAIIAVGDSAKVRYLLQEYEAGDIDFEELVAEIRALNRPVH